MMIQDIAPHRYDHTYVTRPAAPGDAALCYDRRGVVLRREGECYALPRFHDGIPTAGARHLFAIDGVACFLAAPPAALPQGCEWVDLTALRAVRPLETAFAAVTGAHLYRWYRDRRFCPRCGTPMAPGTAERSMVCPDCGLTDYPKICPAVIVAVKNGDKLLLTRYADRPYRGPALIAGYVEIGETPEDTVRREVMEEVGLRVKNLRYYKSQPWGFTDTLLMGFYCDLDGDDAICLDETELSRGEWLHRDEIPSRESEISLTGEMIDRFRRGLE